MAVPKGIIVALVLMPSEFGFYNSIYLWFHYLTMFNIGLCSAAGRESAHYFGQKGKEALGIEIQNKAISIDFLVALAVTFLFLAFSLNKQNILLISCFFLVGISYLLNKISSYYDRFNSSRNLFTGIAKANLLGSVLGPILIVSTIYFLKVYALFIIPIIVWLAKILYFKIKMSLKFRFTFDFSGMRKHLYNGMFFGISSMLSTLFFVIDRTFIKLFLNNTIMGLYSFSLIFTMMMYTLFTNFQSVVLNTLNKSSANVNKEDMFKKATHYIKYMLLLACLMIIFAQLCYYVLVNYFLVNYKESGTIFVIFSLMIYFYAMFVIPNSLLYSKLMQKERLSTLILLTGVVSGIIFNAVFLHLGWKGEGIALGTVLAQAIITILTLFVFIKCSAQYNIKHLIEIVLITFLICIFSGFFYYMAVSHYPLIVFLIYSTFAILTILGVSKFYFKLSPISLIVNQCKSHLSLRFPTLKAT